ncbi:hypothetical protein M6B38_102380 [Iris pallida]|uniref:Uncharacterized protein n=1 Tax=Iris pallida TaxID=29817 RepID=A0AAX6IT78_IRIPA|nr:hypothetical protein M6B38_102380 [Iris pallida]
MEDKNQQSSKPPIFFSRGPEKNLSLVLQRNLYRNLSSLVLHPLFFISRGRQRRIGIHQCHPYHLIASNMLISAHSKFWPVRIMECDYVFDLGAGNRGS